MSYIRSFIAANLPQKTKDQIGKFQETLTSKPFDIRWENPENFHINLLFLGETREPSLSKIANELISKVKLEPFKLSLGHLDYLYKKHGDSIVYLSVEGDLEKLNRLQEQVCLAVEKAANYSTPRRFFPHITLGRVKPRIGQQEKKNILSQVLAFQPKRLSPFVVTEIKLMQTTFTGDAAHLYSSISSVSL